VKSFASVAQKSRLLREGGFFGNPPGLGWRAQVFVFLIAAVAVVSRRPDAILHPQFFAEDGMFWYADAYNIGWFRALLIPLTGYFQTLPRLSAALSLVVPLLYAPLVLNLIAIIIQVLPVTFLLSSRCANWGSSGLRGFLAATYIALPNSRELDAAITEAQWHMALMAVLVVLSSPSQRKAWRVFDVAIVLLSGLTGPFCIALLPIAAFVWWGRRARWQLVLAALVALCAAVQLCALVTTAVATRSHETLGATPALFLRMLIGDVYLGAMFGQNHFASQGSVVRLIFPGILATAILVVCLLRANAELRLFVVYSFALYFASLQNPMISDTQPQWHVLADAPGLRYWFFPMLAFVWAAIWCVTQSRLQWPRWIAGFALVCMFVGITKDWKYPGFDSHNFPEYARRFQNMPIGQAMVFPLYPDGWTMQLVKKSAGCPTLPMGIVDEPRSHAQVSNAIVVSGWVTAPEPIRSVSIYLDGALKESLKPNLSRPDVDRKFPDAALKDKGWRATVELSKTSPGMHLIEVHATFGQNCEVVLGSASVEKTQ
jgi:hypothetical protein